MNYLYNGLELPALPEWDKSAYPYVVLTKHATGGDIGLYALPKIGAITGSEIYWPGLGGYPEEYVYYLLKEEGWGNPVLGSYLSIGAQHIVWCNTDIFYADDWFDETLAGTMFLEASYPINAETGEEITDYVPIPVSDYTPNPTAMALGMLAGQAVRRMRVQT